MEAPIIVGTFGILNNPDYRQEPWKASIKQKLVTFDQVALICGNEDDIDMLAEAFPGECKSKKLVAEYRPWPFPDWSYEELPRHLNAALNLARSLGWDWGVRLDIDTVIHGKDMDHLRAQLQLAHEQGMWLASIQKLQFFKPTLAYQKGKMPICVRLNAPIAYGFDLAGYTDLCQPIKWDGKTTTVFNGTHYPDMPIGRRIHGSMIAEIFRIHAWNYDYTFRKIERAKELLYRIEKAHERFWRQGYSGRRGDDITPESSLDDFLRLSYGRYEKMDMRYEITDHPFYMRAGLSTLSPQQWGHSLWGQPVVN